MVVLPKVIVTVSPAEGNPQEGEDDYLQTDGGLDRY